MTQVKTFPSGIAVIGALAACTVWAHYTWVGPVDAPLEVGKTSTVQISHGHKFPQSEELIVGILKHDADATADKS